MYNDIQSKRYKLKPKTKSVYSVIKLMELKYVVLVLKTDCIYRPDRAAISL
jgi:hypothetical protein